MKKLNKTLLKYFLLLLIVTVGHVSYGQFQKLNDFIPDGFVILDSASGDINRDGIKDLVVIFKNNTENIHSDTARPLLLLQGNGRGQYKLMARNDNVVLCFGCGGIFGDPYAGITIKNGFFSIEHYGGSNWRWTRTITFSYDLKRKEFVLHRDAGYSWYIFKPKKRSLQLYNKQDFDRLYFSVYSYMDGQ
jgi:hypothetical protein